MDKKLDEKIDCNCGYSLLALLADSNPFAGGAEGCEWKDLGIKQCLLEMLGMCGNKPI